MKTRLFIILLATIAIFTSCKAPYYQVYNVEPERQSTKNENSIIYTNHECTVTYNLWSDGGNVGFMFYNNTDSNIYINKQESFFIKNGISYDYYTQKSTSYTTGEVRGRSTSATANAIYHKNPVLVNASIYGADMQSKTNTYYNSNVVCIPPKTTKVIYEHNIVNTEYENCGLNRFPRRGKPSSVSFSVNDTPITFSNVISYKVGAKSPQVVKHNFYVTQIGNLNEWDAIELRSKKKCGKKVGGSEYVYKGASAYKFFLKYFE